MLDPEVKRSGSILGLWLMRADVGLHVDTTAHCTSIVDFVISSCIAWHRLRIRGLSFWIRKNSFLRIFIKHKTVTFLLHTATFLGFYGRLAQRISLYVLSRTRTTDLENEVSPTVAQPPGTLFLPTSTSLLTPVHSESDSRVYFMIVLTTDYCWRSWTCRIAAPDKFHVDSLIHWFIVTLFVSLKFRLAGQCWLMLTLQCAV